MKIAARSRRGRSTPRGVESRDHILASALEVLAESGYAGASIAAICNRADISAPSIYWHFGSKAGLFQALQERTSATVLDEFRSAVAKSRDPLGKLDRLLNRMRELVIEQPVGSLTLVAMASQGGHANREMLDAQRRSRQAELQAIQDDFRAVLGPVPDLDLVAVVLTAFSNYAALVQHIDSGGAEVDAIFSLLRRTMLRLLEPHANLGNSEASQ